MLGGYALDCLICLFYRHLTHRIDAVIKSLILLEYKLLTTIQSGAFIVYDGQGLQRVGNHGFRSI